MPRKIRGITHAPLVAAARDQRREPTHAERILWLALRGSQLDGIKFRRQHAVGSYILDFYCVAHALAIEVDGAIHDRTDQKQYDQERTEFLSLLGNTVMRFTNDQVEKDVDTIINRISERIKKAG